MIKKIVTEEESVFGANMPGNGLEDAPKLWRCLAYATAISLPLWAIIVTVAVWLIHR